MPKRKRPTAKQRKLIEQIPAIVSGKKTKKAALLEAGYSENVADKQAEEVLGSAGVRDVLLKAMDKAGATIEKVAQAIGEGLTATKMHGVGGMMMSFDKGKDDKMKPSGIGHTEIEVPDFATRHKYVVTALEVRDAFPTKKLEITTPLTYKELETGIKAKTVEEAQKMAEEDDE